MGKFNVSPGKENSLLKKMDELGIYESDITETFVRSSGKGGQNLNKNSTCVNLRHNPTGITVKFSKERSQLLNRFLARRELVKRIEDLKLGRDSAENIKINKIRKQKSRRRRKSLAKQKIQ